MMRLESRSEQPLRATREISSELGRLGKLGANAVESAFKRDRMSKKKKNNTCD